MTRKAAFRRDSNFARNWVLSLLIVFLTFSNWYFYAWLRSLWSNKQWPNAGVLTICVIVFSASSWLMIFLSSEFRRYRGMSMDALFAGGLFAVSAALTDKRIQTELAACGLRYASWILFICTLSLLTRNCYAWSVRGASEAGAEEVL